MRPVRDMVCAMRRWAAIFGIILLVTGTVSAAAAQELRLSELRLGEHADKTRLVLELSQAADFRAFILNNPDRLVVDLPDFMWGAAPALPRNRLIAGQRSGQLQAGIDRLVFDLSVPVKILSAFLLPRGNGLPDRLVIDITQTSKADALAMKDKIHGTLDTAGPSYSQSDNRTAGTPVPSRKPAGSSPAFKPLIVIDAGHGGQDPGATGGRGRYEKHVTLATAKELKRQLEASGHYTVKLTRETDKFIKLAERVKIAQRAKADLFVSIHADSIDKPDVSGASIYTLSDTASDAQTAKLAARENKADAIAGVDLSHEDQDVANILINLAMRDTMNQSKFFANTVVSHFNTGGVRMLQRPHRYAGFAVLKAPDIPSVLIEIGFMSNKREADALLSDSYQRKIAASIKSGIDAYFAKVQKSNKN